MGERIVNFEAKRIHQDFKLCCIADENVYPKNIKGIVENVLRNLDAVQKKEEYPNWERHEVREVSLDSEEIPKRKPKATMTDQITQYGDMFDVRKKKEFKKWKSKTPAKLVDELNQKLYDMRYQKADWDDEEENGYGYGKWRWG